MVDSGQKTVLSFEKRFWEKVDRSLGIGGCWVWKANKNPKGYGNIVKDGGQISAHRASWELHNGPIPDGLHVLHDCPDGDNPSCVNPAHLYLGTNRDNVDDRVAKGRQSRGASRPNAKLTEDQVCEIRRRYKKGIVTAPMLAKEFGISPVTVIHVVNRRSWKHV